MTPAARAPMLRADSTRRPSKLPGAVSGLPLVAGALPLGETPHLEMLRLFVLVATEGSISGAARRLDLSASMANRKLAALERILKVRLFDRSTRSVQLTVAGGVALNWAQDALGGFKRLGEELEALMKKPSGVIRLAVNHYASTHYLPGLLKAFLSQYPDIRISITTTEDVEAMLDANFDLAIVVGRIPDSRVVAFQLRPYRRVLCASRDYVERYGRPKHPADLAQHLLLVHSTQEAGNWCFRKGSKTFEQSVHALVEADSHLMLKEMALAGLGVARLGEHILKSELESGKLVELLGDYVCTYPGGEIPGLWLVYPQRAAPFRTRVLIEFLQQNLSEVVRKRRASG
jgi:DNA-binding transcriptional LysR family regulator